jgi:predicted DNA-binding transcriptional regulator YafY
MADRAARLMAVIDLLQTRGQLTTGAIAELLGVSERTIRRDLVSLQDLELPVRVTPGRYGGVTIEPGALLAPLRFTNAELVALLLGVRTMAAAADSAFAPAARSALARLESVMTPRARERAHALADALVEAPLRGSDTDETSPPDSEVVLQLAEAIRACERVRLHYASPASGHTSRDVDPYGLVRLKHWYLAAHCHLRGGLRTFRLDRIRRLDRDGPRFRRPDGFDAFAAVTSSIALAPFPGTVMCRVRLATDLEQARRAVPPDATVLEPDGDGVLLSTRYPAGDLADFALYMLRLPWRFDIIEPGALRDAFRAVAARALEVAEPPT